MCIQLQSIRRPGSDKVGDIIQVPCGKCYECFNDVRNSWSFRLGVEHEHSISSYFVTLTYSDQHVTLNDKGVPSVFKKHFQDFMKRLRNRFPDSKLRYYAVSEYGSKTFRPHYHLLLFNALGDRSSVTDKIIQSWDKGLVHVGHVTDASIHYTTKYCITHQYVPAGANPTFSLMSRNPGIGYQYLDTHFNYHKQDLNKHYVSKNGIKFKMPRFYHDGFYDDSDKDRLREISEARSDVEYRLNQNRFSSSSDYFRQQRIELDSKVFNDTLIRRRLSKSDKL